MFQIYFVSSDTVEMPMRICIRFAYVEITIAISISCYLQSTGMDKDGHDESVYVYV